MTGYEDGLSGKLNRIHERFRDALAEHIEDGTARDSYEMAPKCESPIERLMLEAMLSYFWLREICSLGGFRGASRYLARAKRDGDEDFMGETNFIQQQVELGDYRVDFMLCRWERPRPDLILTTPVVVIECDGHDFHERTKEQAQRDKARDRELQQCGVCVLRYTGSEIWRDAWGCAEEIGNFLDEKIRFEYEGK